MVIELVTEILEAGVKLQRREMRINVGVTGRRGRSCGYRVGGKLGGLGGGECFCEGGLSGIECERGTEEDPVEQHRVDTGMSGRSRVGAVVRQTPDYVWKGEETEAGRPCTLPQEQQAIFWKGYRVKGACFFSWWGRTSRAESLKMQVRDGEISEMR